MIYTDCRDQIWIQGEIDHNGSGVFYQMVMKDFLLVPSAVTDVDMIDFVGSPGIPAAIFHFGGMQHSITSCYAHMQTFTNLHGSRVAIRRTM